MGVNLYTAPVDSITADDVTAFLDEDRPEGPLLDYKEENPARPGIPETAIDAITAFANTYGGLLILGVDSDPHTNRPTACTGLTLTKKKLEEALMSRCFSSIVPPVVPEVRVCPFRSAPAVPADDRAFVVVRVYPSAGSVHAIQGNQVKIRVGSQSSLADVPTLRLLFERERNREGVVTKWGDDILQQAIALRAVFAGEAKQPQWAPGSQRIYFELLPIDATTDLLPFGEQIAKIGSLDRHLVTIIGGAEWATIDDGRVPMPNGLGMPTTFLGRRSMTREERNAGPLTLMYFDRSGALLADIPTLSLGSAQPGPRGLDTLEFSQKLLYRIATLVQIAIQFLTERDYHGRVQITTWVDKGSGPVQSRQVGDRGNTLFLVDAPWDEYKGKLAAMVSRMTRSWIGFTFSVHEWGKGMEPDLVVV